jgi:hypothetical protein
MIGMAGQLTARLPSAMKILLENETARFRGSAAQNGCKMPLF